MGKQLVIRNTAALQEWARRIEECKRSGETAIAWCNRNGINVKTYYYWHCKVMHMYDQIRQDPNPNTFYEIPQAYDVSENKDVISSIVIGAIKLDIYKGADAQTLVEILKAMQQC